MIANQEHITPAGLSLREKLRISFIRNPIRLAVTALVSGGALLGGSDVRNGTSAETYAQPQGLTQTDTSESYPRRNPKRPVTPRSGFSSRVEPAGRSLRTSSDRQPIAACLPVPEVSMVTLPDATRSSGLWMMAPTLGGALAGFALDSKNRLRGLALGSTIGTVGAGSIGCGPAETAPVQQLEETPVIILEPSPVAKSSDAPPSLTPLEMPTSFPPSEVPIYGPPSYIETANFSPDTFATYTTPIKLPELKAALQTNRLPAGLSQANAEILVKSAEDAISRFPAIQNPQGGLKEGYEIFLAYEPSLTRNDLIISYKDTQLYWLSYDNKASYHPYYQEPPAGATGTARFILYDLGKDAAGQPYTMNRARYRYVNGSYLQFGLVDETGTKIASLFNPETKSFYSAPVEVAVQPSPTPETPAAVTIPNILRPYADWDMSALTQEQRDAITCVVNDVEPVLNPAEQFTQEQVNQLQSLNYSPDYVFSLETLTDEQKRQLLRLKDQNTADAVLIASLQQTVGLPIEPIDPMAVDRMDSHATAAMYRLIDAIADYATNQPDMVEIPPVSSMMRLLRRDSNRSLVSINEVKQYITGADPLRYGVGAYLDSQPDQNWLKSLVQRLDRFTVNGITVSGDGRDAEQDPSARTLVVLALQFGGDIVFSIHRPGTDWTNPTATEAIVRIRHMPSVYVPIQINHEPQAGGICLGKDSEGYLTRYDLDSIFPMTVFRYAQYKTGDFFGMKREDLRLLMKNSGNLLPVHVVPKFTGDTWCTAVMANGATMAQYIIPHVPDPATP